MKHTLSIPFRVTRALLVTASLTGGLLLPTIAHADANQPKLVVQITVDGLRADLIERYKHNFGQGGFRYLMDEASTTKTPTMSMPIPKPSSATFP
ncbi:alkaline phosphatase [Vibrio maritimus]|uniref:Alkaline phosphatase n=1 Tax=Vibrio maritimus TaxID=990268 RepID=A0A090SYZ4_9VIBR|nr:alkaline phosphatase [Vibrio maritimus]